MNGKADYAMNRPVPIAAILPALKLDKREA